MNLPLEVIKMEYGYVWLYPDILYYLGKIPLDPDTTKQKHSKRVMSSAYSLTGSIVCSHISVCKDDCFFKIYWFNSTLNTLSETGEDEKLTNLLNLITRLPLLRMWVQIHVYRFE